MDQLTESHTWNLLKKHAEERCLSEYQNEEDSKESFIVHSDPITLDYKYQKVTSKTIDLLFDLAKECKLSEKIKELMRGERVNKSRNLPALHTALRANKGDSLQVSGRNIIDDVMDVREKMRCISQEIRERKWLGYSGKPITSIVNVGIGGSDLGPKFCVNALSSLAYEELSYHFISDVDPLFFKKVINKLNPETTLFLICSKSFTTKETIYNARKAIEWLGQPKHLDKHFIAVTAKAEKAKELGIENILPVWDWVGGRYSLCSAINLITCIAIGYEAFADFLAGSYSMDSHFANTPLHKNMPVMLALLGIWNINFLNLSCLLLLVYTRELELFIPYIQQLDMESNGKSINNLGKKINYATGPIVWGGIGNQAQHSYYQLLCQGSHKIAADFISIKKFDNELINEFCNKKIQVLSEGVTASNYPFGDIPGGMPINHIRIDSCTPFSLGALVALYEHKIFVQSVLWDINAFDQPGVESAKSG
jgi:glucose-6-phosphate isomerase